MSAYSVAVLALSPVGYWRLGEPSGTTATDAVGANNMTYKNSPVLGAAGAIAGDADTAATFNGVTGFKSARVTAVPLNATDNWTIMGWLKPGTQNDSSNTCLMISIGTSLVGYGLGVNNNNFARMWYNTGNGLTDPPAAALTGGVYSFLVGRRQSGTARVFVNGALADPNSNNTASPSTPTTATTIACRNDSEWFIVGTIDEVAIFNTALSDAAILNLYNIGAGIFTGLPFNELGLSAEPLLRPRPEMVPHSRRRLHRVLLPQPKRLIVNQPRILLAA